MYSAGDTATRPSPLLGTIAFIVLAGVVPLAIVEATPANGYAAWPGAFIIAVISAARFSWTISSRRRHIVEMVVSMFTYGFLGVAPLIQLRTRADISTSPGLVDQYTWESVLIVIAGFGALCLGSVLATVRPSVQTVRRQSPTIRGRRTLVVTIFAFGMVTYYLAHIGFGSVFKPRLAVDALTATAWPDPTTAALISRLASMGLLVAAVAQILQYRQRKLAGQAAPPVLLAVTVIVLLIIVNPVNSPRYVLGTVYVALLAASGVWSTMRRYRVTSSLTLAGLFFVFPLASTFRNSLSNHVQLHSPLQTLSTGDFDSFYQINNAAYYVAMNGIAWGNQLLGVVFFWVPRSLWLGKPIDTGILLAQFRGYQFTNLSAPLWAELFVNGGWIFLIIGMLALGFGMRRWDVRLHDQITERAVPTVIGCIVPIYSMILLRGSLLQATSSLAVILVLGWFVTAQRRATSVNSSVGHDSLLV